MRAFPMALLVALAGCAGAPSRPSTPAERTPSPESVTRDNPGGDAHNPTDAALTRLLATPLDHRSDKFRTLRVHLPDAKNWKRVRFFGHPTRAGFRYGKDPAYAVAVIEYGPAEGDDAPHACLERYVRSSLSLAEKFDLDVAPLTRRLGEHYRGVESVDWVARERERQQRREQARERRARHRAELMRGAAAARARPGRLAGRAGRRVDLLRAAGVQPDADQEPGSGPGARDQLGLLLRSAERRAHLLAHRRAASDGSLPDEDEVEVFVFQAPGDRLRVVVHPPMTDISRPARLGGPAGRPRPAPLSREEYWNRGWQGYRSEFGMAAMPVVLTSGQFQTLFDSDRYVAAVVAYRSWPGSCLVQGFAVKVGSDEKLAEQVIDHWVDEVAPRTIWEKHLRSQPAYENR